MSDEESFVILGSSPQSFMSHCSREDSNGTGDTTSAICACCLKVQCQHSGKKAVSCNSGALHTMSEPTLTTAAMETAMAKIETTMRSAKGSISNIALPVAAMLPQSSPQQMQAKNNGIATPNTAKQNSRLSMVAVDALPTEETFPQQTQTENKEIPTANTATQNSSLSMMSVEALKAANPEELAAALLKIESPLTTLASCDIDTTPSPNSSSISIISMPAASVPYSVSTPLEITDALMESGVLQRDGVTSTEMIPNNDATSTANIATTSSSTATLSNSATSIKENIKPASYTRIAEAKLSEPSLAASFILGEINATDVLRNSVYSQFPSFCSMQGCAEDVVKLQNLMTEYLDLKTTLIKVNSTMKCYYEKSQQWKDNMQRVELEYKRQADDMQRQIAALRNENIDLKRDVNEKMEQIKISEELRQKDQADLVQEISSKTSQISNMCLQIEKLEQHQLSSFEYVPKNADDTRDKPDYIDRQEHQRIIKELERKMSEHVAENYSLKDVQTQYIDEITCLKVNLTAAEELIKQSRNDIALLKAKDKEKSEIFTVYEEERDRMREELNLLRQQVDVYSKDFQMERIARESLAGEKDSLLQDLRILQRKNQELIEEAQKQFSSFNRQSPIKAGSPTYAVGAAASPQRPIRELPPPAASNFLSSNADTHRCPVCSRTCKSLSLLQSHVNMCLDKN